MSTLSRPPFVVIGTGRCGTVSITEIIRACDKTHVTHEEHYLHWYDHADPQVGDIIRDAREHAKRGITRGYVGFMYLPHIPTIRSSIPELRVVHLWREKQEVVESFRTFKAFIRPSDKRHWVDKSEKDTDVNAAISKSFPLIDAYDTEQAFGFYWEMYERMAREYIAEPVFRMHMSELNDSDRLNDLCDFLAIDEACRHFPENRKFHTTEDVVPKGPTLYYQTDRSVRHEISRQP